MYCFNLHDLSSIQSLRGVTTVNDANNKSSAGQLLVLYSVDQNGFRNVIKLINGSRVGLEVSSAIPAEHIGFLPSKTGESPTLRYELLLDGNVSITRCIYQVFIGDMDKSVPGMTTFHTNADSILRTIALAGKHSVAYSLKYTYGADPEYILLSKPE